MASDINQIILVGRLTRDCELKYTSGGMAIGSMALAVNRRVKKGDQWTDEGNFFDVTLFGKQAEGLNQYLLKGTQIAVTGELVQERWEKDGQKRSAVKINAQGVQLLGSAKGGQPQGKAPEFQVNTVGFDDDIPF